MQEKIKLYLEYVANASFWYDIKLIFQTFKVIVTKRQLQTSFATPTRTNTKAKMDTWAMSCQRSNV